jgi:hypothetical protein
LIVILIILLMANNIVKEDAAERVLKLLIEEKIILRVLKIIESEEYSTKDSQFKYYKSGRIIKPLDVPKNIGLWIN